MSLVLYETRGAVAILTLNNPEQYNAMRAGLLQELGGALQRALEDFGVRSIILTGAGKGFCSGASLSAESFGSGCPGTGQLRPRNDSCLNHVWVDMGKALTAA